MRVAEVVLVSVIGWFLYTDWEQSNRREISAAEYRELTLLAEKSCAGRNVLSDAVRQGPVLVGHHDELHLKLQTLAEDDQIRSVRADLLGENGDECL